MPKRFRILELELFRHLKKRPKNKTSLILADIRQEKNPFVLDLKNKKTEFYTFLAVLLILISLSAWWFLNGNKLKAETTQFYPSVCLGNWTDPENAEGKPDLEENADYSEFNSGNSAFYGGGQKQIFCGQFKGELAEGAKINQIALKFSWAEGKKENLSVPDYSENSAGEIIDSNPEIFEGVLLQASSTPEISPAEAPEPESSSEPKEITPENPQSFLKTFVFPALAEEEIVPSEIPTLSETKAPENTPSASPENTPEPTPEPEIPPESPEPQNSADLDEVFIIKYSLDGEKWENLARVKKNDFPSELSMPFLTIEDLAKVQISIESEGFNDDSIAFLDGMFLKIEYENTAISISEQEIPSPAGPGEVYEDIFPFFAEGNFESKDNALTRDLGSTAFSEEFGPENSSFLRSSPENTNESAESDNKETEENKELVFSGFTSANVERNLSKVFVRLSLAAKNIPAEQKSWLWLEYSFNDGRNWQKFAKIDLSQEASNQANNNYRSYPLSSMRTLRNLSALRIKVRYEGPVPAQQEQLPFIFIDSIWLQALRDNSNPEPKNIPTTVISQPGKKQNSEIFIVNNNSPIQITETETENRNPQINKEGDIACWESEIDGKWQIMAATAPNWKSKQVSAGQNTNLNCKINGNIIVWQSWVDDNWEIMEANKSLFGWSENRLTEDSGADINPDFSEGKIIWEKGSDKVIRKFPDGFVENIKYLIF